MNRKFLSDMTRATTLIRAGNLTEATALLQLRLQGTGVSPAAKVPGPASRNEVIDGVFTVLPGCARKPEATKPPPQQGRTAADTWPRRALGETLRHLSRGGMPDGGIQSGPQRDHVANFTAYHQSGAAGSREYMLFVPDPMPEVPCPVVVMLHGCTQSPADFAAGTGMNALAQAQGVIVVYPAQPTSANMNKCWNWFRPEDQQRDTGEMAILAAITREVLATQYADPARVYVAGLSAGGAAAVLLAQAYPDMFAAVGVHSGLAAGSAQDIPQAFAAMRSGAAGKVTRHSVPMIVFHGTADTTVHIDNAHAVVEQAQRGMIGKPSSAKAISINGRSCDRMTLSAAGGETLIEVWLIRGAGHAWSGGSVTGSYTDPKGPDASSEMLRFFIQHQLP